MNPNKGQKWKEEFHEMWKVLDFEVCTRCKSMNTQTLADYEQAQPDDIIDFISSLLSTIESQAETNKVLHKHNSIPNYTDEAELGCSICLVNKGIDISNEVIRSYR
jgi:hypothetical protein